jgi:hypothetical protein
VIRTRAALLVALFMAAGPLIQARAEAAPGPTRRLALVVGANRGGERNVRLRYATSDARSFADLLVELGGVRSEDLVLLVDQPLSSFRDASERLRARAASAVGLGQRCEFVFYYSGHSDEEGLLFENEKLPYSDLRAAIERVPAAVRVAILDSCSSGSITRAKGGSAKPAFLFDASSDMEGHAYITSSSAAEAAQESDKLGGSFFTHHLVSALRGAADVRGQGKVTLNEAYAYAFRETLASTEKTQYGPQHPAYEISLTGSGDLVVTDLRSSRAGILFSDELEGAIYVRDSKGDLAVELDKELGGRMEIGLPQGKYSVSMSKGDSRMQADVVVPASGRAFLSAGDFRPQSTPEKTTIRGLEVTGADEGAPSKSDKLVYETKAPGFSVSFDAKYKLDLSRGVFSSEEDKVVAFSALWGQARDVNVQVATLACIASGDLRGMQYSIFANGVKGGAGGAQVTTFANFAVGGIGGVQMSSGYNYSGGSGRGAQIGLVNKTEELRGAQLGIVNIGSSVRGTQIGVVNIAERIDGLPVGLINIEKDGIRSVQCWTEGVSSLHVGFALGTRKVYTLFQGGLGLKGEGLNPFIGIGEGARLSFPSFYGDFDLSWRAYQDDARSYSFKSLPRLCLRTLGGFPVKGPGAIAGMSLECLMPGLSHDDDGNRVTKFTAVPTFLAGFKF